MEWHQWVSWVSGLGVMIAMCVIGLCLVVVAVQNVVYIRRSRAAARRCAAIAWSVHRWFSGVGGMEPVVKAAAFIALRIEDAHDVGVEFDSVAYQARQNISNATDVSHLRDLITREHDARVAALNRNTCVPLNEFLESVLGPDWNDGTEECYINALAKVTDKVSAWRARAS